MQTLVHPRNGRQPGQKNEQAAGASPTPVSLASPRWGRRGGLHGLHTNYEDTGHHRCCIRDKAELQGHTQSVTDRGGEKRSDYQGTRTWGSPKGCAVRETNPTSVNLEGSERSCPGGGGRGGGGSVGMSLIAAPTEQGRGTCRVINCSRALQDNSLVGGRMHGGGPKDCEGAARPVRSGRV